MYLIGSVSLENANAAIIVNSSQFMGHPVTSQKWICDEFKHFCKENKDVLKCMQSGKMLWQ